MDRDFERFNGGPNEDRSKRLHVTITPQRLLRINRNVYQQLGKPDAVRLYYSPKRDTIGIEVASHRLNGAFPVLPCGPSYRINAAPFLRHYNIRIDTTIKFANPEIVGNELFLNLADIVSVAAKKRKK